jgi:hypothetical protein
MVITFVGDTNANTESAGGIPWTLAPSSKFGGYKYVAAGECLLLPDFLRVIFPPARFRGEVQRSGKQSWLLQIPVPPMTSPPAAQSTYWIRVFVMLGSIVNMLASSAWLSATKSLGSKGSPATSGDNAFNDATHTSQAQETTFVSGLRTMPCTYLAVPLTSAVDLRTQRR